ncbi:hypothetical protein [Luteibacter aegosomatissinici]|uniref:hypothetical protein n=1 Tax=Luteibacter aegosomatissinici TaxID=2911539 RepID=UPI001FF9DD0A|nr:hypothetical protein [Luteibacter aegosomatissinici]UPG92776.1 hypothetical protein L2Y97_12970 [Luteibacter aegosomatissinici]
MTERIEVVDEHGQRLVALVTHARLGQEVVWSAEIEGAAVTIPLSGTAGDEGSIAAALQAHVLRWGITASPGARVSDFPAA